VIRLERRLPTFEFGFSESLIHWTNRGAGASFQGLSILEEPQGDGASLVHNVFQGALRKAVKEPQDGKADPALQNSSESESPAGQTEQNCSE
jgi:hypothetical protein